MTHTDIAAYLALVVSIPALGLSVYNSWRDRYVVDATAMPHEESGWYHLKVNVTNKGRRPISISHVVAIDEAGDELTGLFEPQGGNRIEEGDYRSCLVSLKTDLMTCTELDELRAHRIEVIDSTGRRHKAKWTST